MYEMLVGYPPFYSDEPMATCRKVMSGLLEWITFCPLNSARLMPMEAWIIVFFLDC